MSPLLYVPRRAAPPSPYAAIWTHNKALMVREYLYEFVQITKHGIYIDGFAGPQDSRHWESWTANRVLEIGLLTAFHWHEIAPDQLRRLDELRALHPDRSIGVHAGDFNTTVEQVLRPDVIPPTAATFCLLDQRKWECEWRTVQRLAAYKAGSQFKIELFYFLADMWLDRVLAATTANTDRLDRWWGGGDWRDLMRVQSNERARLVATRFKKELGYRFVSPWPVLNVSGRVTFFMIHASDHPRAPLLMEEAYRKVVGLPPEPPADQLTLL